MLSLQAEPIFALLKGSSGKVNTSSHIEINSGCKKKKSQLLQILSLSITPPQPTKAVYSLVLNTAYYTSTPISVKNYV